MGLQQIEAKLREEAAYGRTPSERLAQILNIIMSLRKFVVPGHEIQEPSHPSRGATDVTIRGQESAEYHHQLLVRKRRRKGS
jgi:hypothetical protein